jgi:hypothetical protein
MQTLKRLAPLEAQSAALRFVHHLFPPDSTMNKTWNSYSKIGSSGFRIPGT